MNQNLLKLYHSLPWPMRYTVASARGLYLASFRYSAETDTLVAEALEREHWNNERWNQWQQQQLSYVLHRAVTKVPYYRDYWARRRRHGDRSSWEYLENWPVLEKESLRENAYGFVAEDCDVRRMFHEHTSGTTGKSLNLWVKKEKVRAWYALCEARWRKWYGVSRHDRWAILGGQLVTPASQRRPPFWVWNGGLKQLYMSSYHLSPDLIATYLDALVHYRVKYLLGYTSSLYELARVVLQLGRRDLKMAVVITNAEPVFEYQRRKIEEAFQCSVRETYGMAEMVAAAGECEHGRMHLWPEAGLIEICEHDKAVPVGASGDLICTGLINTDMPLIRYRVGDRGVLADPKNGCACTRNLPVIASVEGRIDDVLLTKDGRRIGRLDPVFKADLPVHEAQIIQETLDRVRVRYVPSARFTQADRSSLAGRIRDRLGEIEVVLEAVEMLPRTSNGKFRAVICCLSPEEKRAMGSV